ncbi:MAG: hypothetical protein EBS55_10490 [Flavobacteriaceae bacterium]|nr:hypothetical protein [Flavobacteriaceae bacterium]
MKIAVCLFGQSFRFLETPYPNYEIHKIPVEDQYIVDGLSFLSLKSWKENIIQHNQLDFFIHSWTTKEHHKSKLIDFFSPISYDFEPYTSEQKLPGQFISRYKSVRLLSIWEEQNNFEYDLVILTRLDLVWFRPIKFDEYLDPKKLTILNWTSLGSKKNNMHFEPYDGDLFGVMDVFFSGSSQCIKKLSTLIQFYEDEDYIKILKKSSFAHTGPRLHIEKTGLLEKLTYEFEYSKDLETEYQLYSHLNPYNGQSGSQVYRQYLSTFLNNIQLWKNYFGNRYIDPGYFDFYNFLYSNFISNSQKDVVTENLSTKRVGLSPYKKIKLSQIY